MCSGQSVHAGSNLRPPLATRLTSEPRKMRPANISERLTLQIG